jgi:hypothetical protein
MASAPTITPKKRFGNENDLLSLEKSTARQTIIPTLASSSAESPVSGYLSDLFEESAMHGMTRQPFLVEVFQRKLLSKRRYGIQV